MTKKDNGDLQRSTSPKYTHYTSISSKVATCIFSQLCTVIKCSKSFSAIVTQSALCMDHKYIFYQLKLRAPLCRARTSARLALLAEDTAHFARAESNIQTGAICLLLELLAHSELSADTAYFDCAESHVQTIIICPSLALLAHSSPSSVGMAKRVYFWVCVGF